MHFLLMMLISTVTVNEVTLDTDFLENIDGQWVAPGYSIIEELILDPGDYGIPFLNPAHGSRNVIGFQPFFVDTPDGEKWRIVLAYEGEIVVLQEDSEPRRFDVEICSTQMLNSANGQYVYLSQKIEIPAAERTQEWLRTGELPNPPERHKILLDIETGQQVMATEYWGSCLIANNGYMISITDDSIRFYDSHFNLLKSVSNCITQMGSTPTAYASDGSLFVREYREFAEDTASSLRAYDSFGNLLWESYSPHTGWPLVSEHGEYVFLLSWGRILCLDGSNGELLWEEPHENEGFGMSALSSRSGAAYAFETDATPSEAREYPMRERVLNVGRIEHNNNPSITRIVYQSDEIAFFGTEVVNDSGCSLWRVYFGVSPEVDLSSYLRCLFSSDGHLLYARSVSEADRRYGNIWINSVSTALRPDAIDSTGRRLIWWDKKEIHILTLEEEGASE